MKTRIFLTILTVFVAGVFIGSTVAESADLNTKIKEQEQKVTDKAGVTQAVTGDGLDGKIKDQQKAIDKAIASKTLTKEEGKTVQDNLNRIKERKAAETKEGKMSDIGKGSIENMLDRNNKMISDKKSNPVKPFSRPDVTYRFEKQQARIDGGVKSGVLTKQEAAKLQDNLNKAKAKYAELTKDGKFTQAEEEKMHEMLDKDSKVIDSKKHN